MSYYRNQLDTYLSTITVKANVVLDIGGSAGSISKKVKKFDVKEYIILDNGIENKFHDKMEKIDIAWDINMDIRPNFYPLEKKFDMIFCMEVSEYLYDPLTALKNMYFLLKDKGILYISFCSIYPVHEPLKYDYLRYTKQCILKLISEAGFTDWKIETRKATMGTEALADFYRLEGMHPVKYNDVIFDIGYMCKLIK